MMKYEFSVGQLLLAVRKAHGLTQVELSNSLGVVQSTISKIEAGVFEDVPFTLVAKVSTRFSIPIQNFQDGLIHVTKKMTLKKAVNRDFTESGVFSAQLMHHLLKVISQKEEKIFKKLKLSEFIFAFTQLKFNYKFITKIARFSKLNLLEELDEVTPQVSTYTKKSISTEEYINSLPTVTFVESSPSVVKVHFETDKAALIPVFEKLLALDLKIHQSLDVRVENIEIAKYIKESIDEAKESAFSVENLIAVNE